jgi:cytidylate kinase
VPAEGALLIDSTELSIDEVVTKILSFTNEKLSQ